MDASLTKGRIYRSSVAARCTVYGDDAVALVSRTEPCAEMQRFEGQQDRLVLALVVRAAEREGVLRPDHERGPVPARLLERALERADLGRGHADVERALGDREHRPAGRLQEGRERAPEGVVGDGHAPA